MALERTTLIEIFDPPLCCPSGLCGPSIDPALLDIREATLRIQQQYNGRVRMERYLISQQPGRFMQNPDVLALLRQNGTAILPITAVNGEVKKTKAYPTFEELKEWVEAGRDKNE